MLSCSRSRGWPEGGEWVLQPKWDGVWSEVSFIAWGAARAPETTTAAMVDPVATQSTAARSSGPGGAAVRRLCRNVLLSDKWQETHPRTLGDADLQEEVELGPGPPDHVSVRV